MPPLPVVTRDPHRFPPPGDLSCVAHRAQDEVRIVVAGELDLATACALDESLRRAEAECARIVLDLRQLEFADCCAVRLLLTANRRIRAGGGRLVVVRGTVEIDWFLALAGVEDQLEFVAQPSPAPLGVDRVRSFG